MSRRDIHIIADDYGLSPAVSGAIRMLVSCEAISGTSCMTLFPEWMTEAGMLRQSAARYKTEVGLHLTLTDFKPLSGWRGGKPMLPLGRLLISNLRGALYDNDIEAELDAQLERFVEGVGKLPDFIDGHQHVHFLPVVRRWLQTRRNKFEHSRHPPWIRGAPSMALQRDPKLKAKVAFVRLLARGFDQQMGAARYVVRGPLTGFYNWRKPDNFSNVFDQLERQSPRGAVLMCHPGWIDEILVSRDQMVEARQLEFETLMKRS